MDPDKPTEPSEPSDEKLDWWMGFDFDNAAGNVTWSAGVDVPYGTWLRPVESGGKIWLEVVVPKTEEKPGANGPQVQPKPEDKEELILFSGEGETLALEGELRLLPKEDKE